MNPENLNNDWHILLFGVRRSARYHEKRERFFHRLNRVVLFLNVAFGSAAVVAVISELGHGWIVAFSALVAMASALDLVVDTGGSARLHADLRRRFVALESAMIGEEPDQEKLTRFTRERLAIEQDEPPVLRALDVLCHNELVRALGYGREKEHTLPLWRRLLAQVW